MERNVGLYMGWRKRGGVLDPMRRLITSADVRIFSVTRMRFQPYRITFKKYIPFEMEIIDSNKL